MEKFLEALGFTRNASYAHPYYWHGATGMVMEMRDDGTWELEIELDVNGGEYIMYEVLYEGTNRAVFDELINYRMNR